MSTGFIDFKALKAQHGIEPVAQWLGIHLVHKGDKFRAFCPTCKVDRALVITPGHVRSDGSVGSYFCHSANIGGDTIGLVGHVKGITDQHEAAKLIVGALGGAQQTAREPAKSAKQTVERKAGSYDPEAYVQRLDAANELLAPLGVSPETFRAFKAGYSAAGVHRGKLALPLHDRDGKLTGHFARSLKGESPLLTFVAGQNPAEHIFGAHLVTEGDLCLARDPLDVIVAFENGEANVVAFLTDGISPQQWEMLSSLMDQRKCERSFLF